jgi:predicted anti-sigma-YlaC factor YlaD
MNCTDLEILLCDYVDGALAGEQKASVELHLAECRSCAELARDAAGAVAFMERAAVVEPPAELLTRILFELPSARHSKSGSLWARLKVKWIEPVLQPRFAMGMAMTVLSFAMLGRLAGIEIRQLKPSDLDPKKVWITVEDRAILTWERAVKYYESMRLVYDVQTRLSEWNEQSESQPGTNSAGKPKNDGPSGPGTRSQGDKK